MKFQKSALLVIIFGCLNIFSGLVHSNPLKDYQGFWQIDTSRTQSDPFLVEIAISKVEKIPVVISFYPDEECWGTLAITNASDDQIKLSESMQASTNCEDGRRVVFTPVPDSGMKDGWYSPYNLLIKGEWYSLENDLLATVFFARHQRPSEAFLHVYAYNQQIMVKKSLAHTREHENQQRNILNRQANSLLTADSTHNSSTLSKRVSLPSSLNGYFLVGSSGSMYRIRSTHNSLNAYFVNVSEFNTKNGAKPGDEHFKGIYNIDSQTLSINMKVTPRGRTKLKASHCNKIYMQTEKRYNVIPPNIDTATLPDEVWAMDPIGSPNTCVIARIEPNYCTAGCLEYNESAETQPRMILTANRELADQLSQSRQDDKPSISYQEAQARLSKYQNNRSTNNNSSSSSYFAPEGDCGVVSCAVEDILNSNM